MQCLVDRAHAPLAELLDELIFPEDLSAERLVRSARLARTTRKGTGPCNRHLALRFLEERIGDGRPAQWDRNVSSTPSSVR